MGAGELSVGTITSLLGEMRSGSTDAEERLYSLIYDDLRRLARSHLARRASDLQATDLANAIWLRLFERVRRTEDRAQLFGLINRGMRDLLVDHARRRLALKRGGGVPHVTVSDAPDPAAASFDILDLDEALRELGRHDPRSAEIVSLRFFGGRSLRETADLLGLTLATVRGHWEYARAWLHERLEP